MAKYIRHFITITKHKWYVMCECFKLGLYWQGLTHDLSKYTFTEFFISAKYFTGVSSPIEKERLEKGYSLVWLNHKGKNKHHWEYWIDWDKEGNINANKIPMKYLKEMLCDFIGAGKAYNPKNFSKREPLNYYMNYCYKKRLMHQESEKEFIQMLKEYAEV